LLVKTEAILLKGTNYRETSKIITFYTRSHGKIRGIAKGVRSTKTKWGGALQSMAYLNLFFYFKENKDLFLVSNAEHITSFHSIYNDYEKMQAGYGIIELVNRTTADNQQNEDIFNLLKNSLELLENATKNYVNVLLYFEFKLCSLLGFQINSEMLNFTLNPGEQKCIELINTGNFNSLLNLNISKPTERNLAKFFENYYKNELEHINNSKIAKVFKSQEAL
jgi:hypothetical protein